MTNVELSCEQAKEKVRDSLEYCKNDAIKEAFLMEAKYAVAAEVNKFSGPDNSASQQGLKQMYESALAEVTSKIEQIQREKDSAQQQAAKFFEKLGLKFSDFDPITEWAEP